VEPVVYFSEKILKRKQQKNQWKRVGKILFLAFLIGVVLRFFVIESVYVSTPQMAKTYSEGDWVFVSKLAYGIHIPFTSVYFPFKEVSRNDIVLSAVPNASGKVLVRCIGLPGDTVVASEGRISIDGKLIANPPLLLLTNDGGKQLSKLDWYLLGESQQTESLAERLNDGLSYRIIVPKAGMEITLNALTTTPLYEAIFIDENAEKEAIVKGGSLYIDGEKQETYSFKRNYYWLLSDNRSDGFDSHQFGFVPGQNIEGKALGVWMHLNFPRYE